MVRPENFICCDYSHQSRIWISRDAWNSVKGTSKETAHEEYVKKFTEVSTMMGPGVAWTMRFCSRYSRKRIPKTRKSISRRSRVLKDRYRVPVVL
jgi:hypothetical protein